MKNLIEETIDRISLSNSETDLNKVKGQVFSISPANKTRLINLIGEKCNITCKLNNISITVLWDTNSIV